MKRRTIGSAVAITFWLGAVTAIASPAVDDAKHSEKAAALRQDMRKLWTDHVVWTRDYIIEAVGDQPDAQAAANRLMKNQEDIGTARREQFAGYISRYESAPPVFPSGSLRPCGVAWIPWFAGAFQ